jgi:membrane protease YdiL (CAAX protease family)
MSGAWEKVPVLIRAVVVGAVVAMVGVNLWSLSLLALGYRWGLAAAAVLLVAFVFYCSGHGWPRSTQGARRAAFRATRLTAAQWTWGLAAALLFALAVEAGLIVLFRSMGFPAEVFRRGYKLDIGSVPWALALLVMAAVVAGVCEETGFRGYMQAPLESRYGPAIAILVTSALFTVFHLNQAWALPPVLPLVFAAGALLGLLAWASGSLLPGIIGHAVMDVFNFAFWWTKLGWLGLGGDFDRRPIAETGLDPHFLAWSGALVFAVAAFLVAIRRLASLRPATPAPPRVDAAPAAK